MQLLLALLQTAPAEPDAGHSCLTAIITWVPFLLLMAVFLGMIWRMGYFNRRRGYVARSEAHMDRVEQTLTKIEEHLRKLADRDQQQP